MIKREIGIFLIVGSLTVLIDFISYRTLLWLAFVNIDTAKAIGFIAGTIFAYVANRFWTFSHKPHASGSIWRFILLYSTTLGANVWVNEIALGGLTHLDNPLVVAFLIATGVSALLNFLGMKFFVFRTRRA